MDADFVKIIETLTTKYGKESLFDLAIFKSRLPKSAQNSFKKERHILYIAIEAQAPKEIDAAADLKSTKQTLTDRLRDRFMIGENDAKESIDLLAYILRADRSLKISAPKRARYYGAARGAKSVANITGKNKLWIAIVSLLILLIVIFLIASGTSGAEPQKPPIDNEAKIILI
jgi:hypothetical protein